MPLGLCTWARFGNSIHRRRAQVRKLRRLTGRVSLAGEEMQLRRTNSYRDNGSVLQRTERGCGDGGFRQTIPDIDLSATIWLSPRQLSRFPRSRFLNVSLVPLV